MLTYKLPKNIDLCTIFSITIVIVYLTLKESQQIHVLAERQERILNEIGDDDTRPHTPTDQIRPKTSNFNSKADKINHLQNFIIFIATIKIIFFIIKVCLINSQVFKFGNARTTAIGSDAQRLV